jgi:hypothetical protein
MVSIDISRRKNKEKRELAIYSSKSSPSFRGVDNVTRTDPRYATAVSGVLDRVPTTAVEDQNKCSNGSDIQGV